MIIQSLPVPKALPGTGAIQAMLATMRPLVICVLPAGLHKEVVLLPARNALFSTSSLMTAGIVTIVSQGASTVTAPLVSNVQRAPTALELKHSAPNVLEANSQVWEPLAKMNAFPLRVIS